MNIREFKASDTDELRSCVIEIQNFERKIDPRMPSGESIVDEYIVQMHEKCGTGSGVILMADIDQDVVGYVLVLSRVSSGDLDDGDIEHGLVGDLFVKQAYRGQGIGKSLLQAAEDFVIENGARWLRISVIASNQVARNAYLKAGFSELYVEMEKDLRKPGG